jgi:ribA/ribD-fused uncharacterized protein
MEEVIIDSIKGFDGENRFLSNFIGSVHFEGSWYPSAESAYQAAKVVDPRERKPFQSMSAGSAKKHGSKIEIRKDWDKVKIEVMSAIVFDKFYLNKDLRKKLIDTGDKYIEETNSWGDTFWGVCDGKGENNLGKILMKIREFWK